jgi:hypothetical protein
MHFVILSTVPHVQGWKLGPEKNRYADWCSWLFYSDPLGKRVTRWRSGWGIALQTGRSRDRFLMSLEFIIDKSFRPHYGPGVDSASNRNEYQEYFPVGKDCPCIGLTTLPHSFADCLKIWEPQPLGNLWACQGLYGIDFPLPYLQTNAGLCHKIRPQKFIST